MALKFWLGGEGSDRSRRLTDYILDEADKHQERQYLYVVPEQFGLATQRELVMRSKNKGILNIDVLSFTRLAHRISDEVGSFEMEVTRLDDMGKSLLIGMLAAKHAKDLVIFGDKIDRPGFVDRIKSMISEFMQYGITVDKASELSQKAAAAGRGLLGKKLEDTATLYRLFKEYIRDRYTTAEETLDLVSSLVPNSDTIAKSVVIFDGFTGFTPVQNKLIGVLMEYAIDIHVALVLEDCIQDTKAKGSIQEHELFYLSKKTMAQLGRMADERQIMTEDPYKAQNIGISDTCNLINGLVYNGDRKGEKLNNTSERPIRLLAARNPYEEAGMVISRIRQLIRQKGYHYRDIGVLTGDMESYRHPIERTFARHDIPFFVDRTEPVLLNPFIEYIRSFLRIMCENYSISSVFSYLKSHLTGFSDDDINRLENYCLASNIKGYSAWHKRFDLTTGEAGPDELLTLNGIREAFMEKIDAFAASLLRQKMVEKATDAAGAKEEQKGAGGAPRINAGSVFTIKEFATALYELIVSDGIEDKLKEYAAAFEETGERRLAAEYDRIYVRIMDILDEICLLIPDEKTDIRGFGKILDAGFAAIRIGAVPAGTDYVQIGDLTRSRFDHIKVLFIVGANDGAIPKISDSSGILSENERVFLTGMADDLVLAPTGREDIYTQQLYIYMALEKPEDMVFVSYSRTDAGGKSLLPSYIIGRIREMHPDIRIETRESYPEYLEDEEEAFEELACAIYPVISGTAMPETDKRVGDLLKYFLSDDGYRDRLFAMIDAGIRDQGRKADDTIGSALAHAIYGTRISTSITRLETYAGCAYRYFLEYGLKLHEREVFTVDARDMGSIFHDVMKAYSDLMQKGGYDWTDIEEAKRRGLMDKAVDIVMEVYMPRKLSSAARYTYMAQRVRNIMQRTGDIVNAQVRRGRFKPAFFEVDFDRIDDVASLDIRLSDDEMMRLRGRIDRVDTCSTDDGLYVRIIDYKSSDLDMDLAAVYEGRQLQLLVYLNVAMEGERARLDKEGSEKALHPAGILYYHIDDPYIEAGEADDDEIRRQIMKKLRMKGFVNDDPDILRLMDTGIDADSLVVPVSILKSGEVKRNRQTISEDDLNTLTEYVAQRVRKTGEEIMSGNIAVPKADGKRRFTGPDCGFCVYKDVCGKAPEADKGIKIRDMDWIGQMKEELGESGQ